MNEEAKKDEGLIHVSYLMSIPERFATGPVMGRFLLGMKDGKIVANHCPKCGRTQIPARLVCAVCMVEATEWREVGPEGVLVRYDIVFVPSINPLTGKMREIPYTTANIRLDGTVGDDTFWHLLSETDPKKLWVGMRVRPVWRDDREGKIYDIVHFEPIPGQQRPE